MVDGSKKLKARDEFMAYAEEKSNQKFGKLNAVQQSHWLTRFYVEQIHNKLRSEISPEDLELAIVDSTTSDVT